MIIDLSQFGPEPDFNEVAAVLAGLHKERSTQVIFHLLLHQLDQSREHELVVSTPSDERHYNAGASGASSDLINWLYALTRGMHSEKCLSSLKARFKSVEEEENQNETE